jgi:hypothetical protein
LLYGGVGVAAEVEAALGNVGAVQAAGDLLLCFQGRTPRSLMLLTSQTEVPEANRGTSASRSRQNSSIATGPLLHGGPRLGDAGHGGQAERDGTAELQLKGRADLVGDGRELRRLAA